ncbi:hypothetical protein D3C83_104590 [compost metagenome]
MWNGTTATLKPKPITSIARPTSSSGLEVMPSVQIVSAIRSMFVLPVAPRRSTNASWS